MKENIIQQKSFAFAIRIVNAFKYLQSEKNEFVLLKQLLRSGTSIGTNVEEAIGGQSKKISLQKFLLLLKKLEKQNIGSNFLKPQII